MKAHTRKRVTALLMACVMCLSLLPTSVFAGGNTTVELYVGESKRLPNIQDSDNGRHEWAVEDGSVVSVSEDGVVTGLAVGETVVTHTYYVEKVIGGGGGGSGSAEPSEPEIVDPGFSVDPVDPQEPVDPGFSVDPGVTPKFCVKSNECRNRAKFICRRQRLDRLPPMSTT